MANYRWLLAPYPRTPHPLNPFQPQPVTLLHLLRPALLLTSRGKKKEKNTTMTEEGYFIYLQAKNPLCALGCPCRAGLPKNIINASAGKQAGMMGIRSRCVQGLNSLNFSKTTFCFFQPGLDFCEPASMLNTELLTNGEIQNWGFELNSITILKALFFLGKLIESIIISKLVAELQWSVQIFSLVLFHSLHPWKWTIAAQTKRFTGGKTCVLLLNE